jgi:hypothetical protein
MGNMPKLPDDVKKLMDETLKLVELISPLGMVLTLPVSPISFTNFLF